MKIKPHQYYRTNNGSTVNIIEKVLPEDALYLTKQQRAQCRFAACAAADPLGTGLYYNAKGRRFYTTATATASAYTLAAADDPMNLVGHSLPEIELIPPAVRDEFSALVGDPWSAGKSTSLGKFMRGFQRVYRRTHT